MSNMVVVAAIAIFGLQTATGRSSAIHRTVTVGEARSLVDKALETTGATNLPGYGRELRRNADVSGAFFFFEATWANPNPGSMVIGHYAVDRRTGDVWNAVICEEVTSPSLKRLQRAIRKRLGFTDKDHHRLRRPGPMC
ncbi:MAG: hypothetical protein ABSD27_15830 [Bryobacteraceae bacterium]|jgi:hypothetical protein